jgi:trans-aconitate 2-methyltransferase
MHAWDPATYARHSSEQHKWARELLAKLALVPHERVLDIGCGDGKVTAEIAGSVPQGSVLGVDVSAEMIQFARHTHRKAQFPNLGFELADASHLHFDTEFDVVFSNAALHWVIDHRPVLRGIRRALTRGGRMLLQMGGEGNAAEIIAAIDEIRALPPWNAGFHDFAFPYGFYGTVEYRHWLAEEGLRPVRIELIPKDMIHKDRDALAAWLRTTWMPYTHRVPDHMREHFIGEIITQYLSQRPPDVEGHIHVKMVRLEAEALRPEK